MIKQETTSFLHTHMHTRYTHAHHACTQTPAHTHCKVPTIEMFPTKASTPSSPLWSTTVKQGPKSQKTKEETPLTPHEMNWR